MLAAPGDGTVLCGVAGWLWYPPIISFRTFGVNAGSSPEAADALDNVDCCEPSSRDVPSGPVVITDVTVPLEVDMTFIADVPEAVVVIPLSLEVSAVRSAELWLVGVGTDAGCEFGVVLGGGIGLPS